MTETSFYTSVDNIAARFSRFFLVCTVAVGMWRLLQEASGDADLIIEAFTYPSFAFAALLTIAQFFAVFGSLMAFLTDLLPVLKENHWAKRAVAGVALLILGFSFVCLCLIVFSIKFTGLSEPFGL